VQDHPNAALFRQMSQAADDGDFTTYADNIADDVEWWEIGSDQPIRGKDALFQRMQDLMGQGTIDIELHDVIANDEHVVALVNAKAGRDGRTLDYKTAEIYRVRDGKITHRWAFSDDTAAINEFFK
jgi:ketosteroid isomerase-like protein